MRQLIYKHTCTITNESYIGQTLKTMEERLRRHKWDSNNGSDTHFHRAIRKYGIENFTSEILEECISVQSNLKSKQTIADQREIFWINYYDTYNNGYNLTEGGNGSLGYLHTPKSLINISTNRKNNNEGKYHPKGNRTAKTFRFISPKGEEFVVFDSCKPFCREHNISYRLFVKHPNEIICSNKYWGRATDTTLNTIGWLRAEV